MDPFIHCGLAAGVQAIHDRDIEDSGEKAHRRCGIDGSCIGGLPLIAETHAGLLQRGPRRISPFFVPASILNMLSGHLSIRFGFKGPNLAIATACTSGTHSIGEAMRMIEYGD